VCFFEEQLLSTAARAQMGRLLGVPEANSEAVIRRHLGLCLDTCHAAVEFEDPDETLDQLQKAEIRIAKVQLSAGLRLPELSPKTLDALRAFDEPVYLHQVVARQSSGALLRFVDLAEAFASAEALGADEWRVHFHVPLYTETLDTFTNTQPYLRRILERHAQSPITGAFEVETYTWDALPRQHRQSEVVDSIARELGWVVERLT
jgi:sugar phosphate isomerase/epimerase